MVQTLAQNANGDIFIGANGNLAILSGIAAVEAACATASLAQLGEMVFATQQGIPNFQSLWVGTPDLGLWKAALLETLQNVEGVTQVNSLNLTQTGNTLSYVAEIATIYGQTTITG